MMLQVFLRHWQGEKVLVRGDSSYERKILFGN